MEKILIVLCQIGGLIIIIIPIYGFYSMYKEKKQILKPEIKNNIKKYNVAQHNDEDLEQFDKEEKKAHDDMVRLAGQDALEHVETDRQSDATFFYSEIVGTQSEQIFRPKKTKFTEQQMEEYKKKVDKYMLEEELRKKNLKITFPESKDDNYIVPQPEDDLPF